MNCRTLALITVLITNLCMSVVGQREGPIERPTLRPESESEASSWSQQSVGSVTGHATAVESLMRFASDPPVIARMIAEVCNSGLNNQEVSCYYVLLRYQTNAFFYREAPELLDLSSTNTFPRCRLAGYYGGEYWNFAPDGRTLVTATNDLPMRKTLDYVLCKASELLHVGVSGCLPGAIVWEGNSIRSFTNYFGVVTQGKLRFSPDGFPKGLSISTDYKGNRVPWEIAYEFSATTSVPKYIPSEFSGWSLRGGVRRLKYQVRLLNLELSDQPLEKDFFMPGSLAAKPRKLTITKINIAP